MKSVRWKPLLVCVSLLNVITIGAVDLEEGHNCTIASGIKGICTNFQKCPYAVALLNDNKTPIICSFKGFTPIVCCPAIKSPPTEIRNNLQELDRISDKICRIFYPNPVPPELIIGGIPADVGEFSHMALIGFGEIGNIQWLCGGSLVSLQFVMTAAHCLFSPQFGAPKWVLLGDLDISTNTDGTEPQRIRIKKMIPHPEYKIPSKNHDIALLELETPAKRTEHVAPACLDTRKNHNETQMIATGWGKQSFIGESSKHMLKANMRVVSIDKCRDFFKDIDRSQLPNGIDDDLHICAGGLFDDTCEFERTVLGCLTKLSENVDQHSIILNELLRNSRQSNEQSVIPPEGELMPDFPLKCLKDSQQFDEKLLPDTALTKYMILRLSAVGGSGIESQTRRILKFLISNEVACHFNWKGRDKLSFEKTKIMPVIYDACKRNYPPNERNDLLIANAVKDWLKYGKARMTYKKKSC